MFISKDFTFNNIANTTHNVILVQIDEGSGLSDMGLVYSTELTRDEGGFNSYTETEGEPTEMTLQLLLVNSNNEPIAWTDDKIIEVKNWLITDDFKPFISNDNTDYIYYFKCTNITKKFLPSRKGILEVTFKPYSNYVYKKYSCIRIVNGKTTITIDNPSKKDYYPIIKCNIGNYNTPFKINDLIISGLTQNENITIDNLMLTVLNQDGENRFNNCNRKWFKLSSGSNSITISGVGRVEILAEFPIAL